MMGSIIGIDMSINPGIQIPQWQPSTKPQLAIVVPAAAPIITA
jgi:hypothetical protein